jgi:hypothetical protein
MASSDASPWIIAYPLSVPDVWTVDVDVRPACEHATNVAGCIFCPVCGIKNQQYDVQLKPGFTAGDKAAMVVPAAFGRWECVGRVLWNTYINTDGRGTRVPIGGTVFLVLVRAHQFDLRTLISNSDCLAQDLRDLRGPEFDPSRIVMVNPNTAPVSEQCDIVTNKNTACVVKCMHTW